MYDLIFWYTGITVWIVIAIIIAVITIVGFFYLLWELKQARLAWDGIRLYMGVPSKNDEEMRRIGTIFFAAAKMVNLGLTEKQILEWLHKIGELDAQKELK